MVVFVVFNRLEQTFSVEPLLSFEVGYYFLVQQVRPLDQRERFASFLNDIGMRRLVCRRRDMEAGSLWLAEVVPGMLPDLVDRDSLIGVGHEDLIDHVSCFF